MGSGEEPANGVKLSLLGSFHLEQGGTELAIPGAKMRALVSYLAITAPERQPRERLIALLWGERLDDQARQSLRDMLFRLRKIVGPDFLVTEGDDVSLANGNVECDVARFEALIQDGSAEALRSAVAFYRGTYLDGLSLREEAFEAWLARERRRLQEMAVAALATLADKELEAGQADEALELARRAVDLDAYFETAHRCVMRALAALGQRSSALEHYRGLERWLEDELSARPDEETKRLRDRIEAGNGAELRSAERLGHRDTGGTTISGTPSIAVLPFTNMSGDPEQDYFSDGITEDIISELSRFRELFVIARSSSFSYKGTAVKVQDIAADLGVRYVLEGSVRAADDRIRVTAQLIDAETGHHIWSERYDREITNLFALQDEIVQTVAGTVAGRLKLTAEDRSNRKPIESLEAYDYALRGQSIAGDTRENNLRARQAYEKAIELDPNLTRAYVGLALSYVIEWFNTWWDPADPPLDHALKNATKAISLDNTDGKAQGILGSVRLERWEYEEAKVHLERALELNPNDADAFAFMGTYLLSIGKQSEAIDSYHKAMRLNPYYPAWYLWKLGDAYYITRQYEKALVSLKEALDRNANLKRARLTLAATYSQLDQVEEARKQVEKLLTDHPDASIEQQRRREYESDEAREHWIGALRKAGLPE